MEGLKILSEEMIRIFGGNTIFPILIVVGLFLLVFGILFLVYYYGFEEGFAAVAISGAVRFMISIVGSIENTYYEKNIEVTPIEDKYFVDITKYEIIKVKGEVIYLKDNNKYNKEGEIIE